MKRGSPGLGSVEDVSPTLDSISFHVSRFTLVHATLLHPMDPRPSIPFRIGHGYDLHRIAYEEVKYQPASLAEELRSLLHPSR